MKLKRLKHVKKALVFYRNCFNFSPPYQILVDGTFCRTALKSKVNLLEQIPKYLNGAINLQTTPCVLKECEALGSLLYGPLKILKQYECISCGHQTAVSARKCIINQLRLKKRTMFVATQDPIISEQARVTPGTPLLFISFNAITLEAPSKASHDYYQRMISNQGGLTVTEQTALKSLAEKNDQGCSRSRRKRKEPKGPNPLSCKKKAKRLTATSSESIKKRHRKHTPVNRDKTL